MGSCVPRQLLSHSQHHHEVHHPCHRAVSASDSKAVTCDECQAAVGDLVTRLLGEESLAEQIAILKLVVWPQLPAEIDCEGTLDMWYADMALHLQPLHARAGRLRLVGSLLPEGPGQGLD